MANTKVTSRVLANDAVLTANIADDQVTTAKIADDVALGGNPTTTTQSAGNNTTRIATTAFVTTAVANIVDSAPSALDTLNELAAALGDDANFSTTITNSIAGKVALSGAGQTIADSGNLTLDAAGDIILDADGGDITFKDGGTSVGAFDLTGGFAIKSTASDADFFIQGNDGGSAINAVQFDMSDAGSAFFNADVYVDRYFRLRTTDDQANQWLLYTNTNDNLEINYNGAGNAEVVVDTSGNVGIGTTSPTSTSNVTTLEISNATTARLLLDSTGTGGRKYGWYTSVDGQFAVYDYDASAERLRVDSSGRVGIGTTSPSYRLTAKSDANTNPAIKVEQTGNTDGWGFIPDNTNGNLEFSRIGGGTAGTHLAITNSGNVGIGTQSPSYELHVEDDASETTIAVRSNVGGSGSAVGGRLRLQLGAQNNSGSGQADTQSGDTLGQILFEGQGTDYSYQGGSIKTIVTTGDGDDNRSNQATAMTFGTIGVGSASETEKFRITDVGTIGITGVGSGSLAGTILINDDGATGTIDNAYYNTGIGYECFDDLTSGDANTGMGFQAFYKLTSGANNTAIGYATLAKVTTANNNTAVGRNALYENLSGYNNTAVGYDAGGQITTGHSNISIGYDSADGLSTGSANIQIGAGTNPDNTSNYQYAIGHGLVGLGGNSFTIGKDNGSDRVYNGFTSNASWTRVSDERYKENITPNTDCGLAFINDLNPVTFTWKARADIDKSLPDYDESLTEPEYDKKLYGLIAQEVKATLDKHKIEDFGGWNVEEKTGIQAISQEMFVHPLIKAVQELSAKLEAAEARIKTLEES